MLVKLTSHRAFQGEKQFNVYLIDKKGNKGING